MAPTLLSNYLSVTDCQCWNFNVCRRVKSHRFFNTRRFFFSTFPNAANVCEQPFHIAYVKHVLSQWHSWCVCVCVKWKNSKKNSVVIALKLVSMRIKNQCDFQAKDRYHYQNEWIWMSHISKFHWSRISFLIDDIDTINIFWIDN